MSPDWDVLCATTLPRLVRLAHSIVRDVQEAEDAVQEALLRAVEVTRAGQQLDAPVAWLVTVVRNEAHNRIAARRRRRRVGTLAVDLEQAQLAESDDRSAAMLHASPEIREAIETLSPSLRAVVEDTVCGRDLRAIAETRGIRYQAAKARLSRARAQVRASMSGSA